MEQQQQNIGSQVSKFALSLYQNLQKNNENLVFSPASIYLALSMVALGADNNTLKEFKQLLNFESQEGFAQVLGQAQKSLLQSQQGITIEIANKIYQGVKVNEQYMQSVIAAFNSQVQEVDFVKNHQQITTEINDWVSEKTNQKIKDLIPQGALDQQTRMVLVNAVYFKGDWKKKFDKGNTGKAEFITQGNENVQVDMMYVNKKFQYFEEKEKYQFVQMFYAGQKYSMNIFLPSNTLEELEKILTFEEMLHAVQSAKKTKIELHLPKFKISPSQSIQLTQTLQKLGLRDCFGDNADFSLLSSLEKLKIDQVLHKGMIEVNEEGAEAAAATALKIVPMCIMFHPLVYCNKPFLFTISNVESNTILFIGKVNNPNESN